MNNYAIILIELFTPEMVADYSIVMETEIYVLIEYTTEPDPTNENWVIFSGELANVKCAQYISELTKENDL